VKVLVYVKGWHWLCEDDPDKTHEVLEEVEKELESITDIETITFSKFYHVKSEYFRKKEDYEAFYTNTL